VNRILAGVAVVILQVVSARADDANAIIEKAVTALGGREKLEKIHGAEVRTKGTISVAGNEGAVTAHGIGQDMDHYRGEFVADLGGNKIEGTTVINGDKGWRKFNGEVTPLDDRALKAEKRMIYLQLVAGNPTLLGRKGFKVAKAADGAVTAAGPDGKEFTISFDPQSGLPAKVVATVTAFGGNDVKQETTYSDFKEFGGIKRATKVESKRDGEPYLKQELVDIKWLDSVDPKTFDEPK
jgi:hypothetical protein